MAEATSFIETARLPARQPRYRQIAHELVREIESGTYPVGASLPTEEALSARFEVSRFTARSALESLRQAGLVARKTRTGTVVVSTRPVGRFSVSFGGLRELLPFLESTRLTKVAVTDVVADRALAAELACRVGERWVRVSTTRTMAGAKAPVSWTEYFLRPAHRDIAARIGRRVGPVYPILEAEHGVVIDAVQQDLGACAMPADVAGRLGVKAGSPALRVIHRFCDPAGAPHYCTISVYPADRFRYTQTVKRGS